MSLAQIISEVRMLSPEERTEVSIAIESLDNDGDEGFQKLIEERMRRMDEGKKVDQDEVMARHAALKALGI
jgi:hypothetical protein